MSAAPKKDVRDRTPAELVDSLLGMPAEEFAELPPATLMAMQDVVDQRKKLAKVADDLLAAALAARFSREAARKLGNKLTGTVNIALGGYAVKVTIPKKVAWDAAGLDKLAADIREAGDEVTKFLTVEHSVTEAAFEAFDAETQKVFEPLRTVSAGPAKFKIVPPKDAK